MGKLVISENVTLDGVIQDPTGDAGFERGGWFSQVSEEDHQGWAEVEAAEADRAEALLIGRGTYDWLVPRWTTRTGAWAERLAAMPKYVVSSTLTDPSWGNTIVLGGDVVEGVVRLKEQVGGEIVVNGSSRLLPTLFQHDLVDEVRLIVYPVVLGAGTRLFPDTPAAMSMRLAEATTVGTGLAMLTYVRA